MGAHTVKLTFIEWQESVFIVIGVGYDSKFHPPEVYYCILLEKSLITDILLAKDTIVIPFSQAVEITDKNRIKAINILFGR